MEVFSFTYSCGSLEKMWDINGGMQEEGEWKDLHVKRSKKAQGGDSVRLCTKPSVHGLGKPSADAACDSVRAQLAAIRLADAHLHPLASLPLFRADVSATPATSTTTSTLPMCHTAVALPYCHTAPTY